MNPINNTKASVHTVYVRHIQRVS